MSCLFKPASRVDVRGVSIQPKIMALRVAVKVETHPITTYLSHRQDKVHGWVLWINSLQLHPHFKAILVLGSYLVLAPLYCAGSKREPLDC